MNAMSHPILTDEQWREALRKEAEAAQKRREDVVKQRIAESMALRRFSDLRNKGA